jgi:hypothetical protein
MGKDSLLRFRHEKLSRSGLAEDDGGDAQRLMRKAAREIQDALLMRLAPTNVEIPKLCHSVPVWWGVLRGVENTPAVDYSISRSVGGGNSDGRELLERDWEDTKWEDQKSWMECW